jgi:hypothetical protein
MLKHDLNHRIQGGHEVKNFKTPLVYQSLYLSKSPVKEGFSIDFTF